MLQFFSGGVWILFMQTCAAGDRLISKMQRCICESLGACKVSSCRRFCASRARQRDAQASHTTWPSHDLRPEQFFKSRVFSRSKDLNSFSCRDAHAVARVIARVTGFDSQSRRSPDCPFSSHLSPRLRELRLLFHGRSFVQSLCSFEAGKFSLDDSLVP